MQPTQQANQTTNRSNDAITPTNKTPEQRKDELFELLTDAELKAPDAIMHNANSLDGVSLKLGNKVIRTLDNVIPRGFVGKSGKRAGETSYSLFDNRYDPIVLRGRDDTKIYIRLSIVSF